MEDWATFAKFLSKVSQSRALVAMGPTLSAPAKATLPAPTVVVLPSTGVATTKNLPLVILSFDEVPVAPMVEQPLASKGKTPLFPVPRPPQTAQPSFSLDSLSTFFSTLEIPEGSIIEEAKETVQFFLTKEPQRFFVPYFGSILKALEILQANSQSPQIDLLLAQLLNCYDLIQCCNDELSQLGPNIKSNWHAKNEYTGLFPRYEAANRCDAKLIPQTQHLNALKAKREDLKEQLAAIEMEIEKVEQENLIAELARVEDELTEVKAIMDEKGCAATKLDANKARYKVVASDLTEVIEN